jgi:hypothetical protein
MLDPFYGSSIGEWQATSSLPGPRDEHASVAVGNHIYVIGGGNMTAEADDVFFASHLSSDTTPPVTTITPKGGSHSAGVQVSLSCQDVQSGCDKTYFTTDGTSPTTESSVYQSPLSLNQTAAIRFFSRDLAGNKESAQGFIFTINTGDPPTGGFVSVTCSPKTRTTDSRVLG